MPDLQPTDRNYIKQVVQEQLRHATPRMGIVEDVHPYTEGDAPSNYAVDVRVADRAAEGEGGGEEEGDGGPDSGTAADPADSPGTVHPYVPVGVTMNGASRGLQVDSLVVVQYRRGDPNLPVVTHCLYDDSQPAPFTEPGDFRRKIGDGVIEIVEDENGDQRINIGKQTTDREGIDAGLSINLEDGSFSLMNESDHGLFVDGDGNAILNWESMAMPWGAAGDVNWDEDFGAGDGGGGGGDGGGGDDGGDTGGDTGGDDGTTADQRMSVRVEDSAGDPVEGADVSVRSADSDGA